jgi:hypothetical protein
MSSSISFLFLQTEHVIHHLTVATNVKRERQELHAAEFVAHGLLAAV